MAGSAVERLRRLLEDDNRYDIPLSELLPTQIEAANEMFQRRIGKIRLLGHRADKENIKNIGEPAELVPLLFAHTAYKSYPESWLTDDKWDRLCKWLDSVSTHRVEDVDTTGVRDIDEWLERLAAHGHYLSCSSGTTGKISMINASMADRIANKRNFVRVIEWATGLKPENARHVFTIGPTGNNVRNNDSIDALVEAYGSHNPDHRLRTRITIGQVARMVALRRSVVEGTALPGDISAYEEASASRQRKIDDTVLQIAEDLVAHRREKLLITGQFPLVHRVAEKVRGLGHGGKDFHSDNVQIVSGGLKDATLPENYREYILETFNIHPKNIVHFYSMQELATYNPRCSGGRYHVAPWLMLLLLDDTGDRLLAPTSGEMEGRAGFFDLLLEGRWNGIITGDRIRIDYGKCACGHQGPTIDAAIVRYKDMPGGDKITCAGTIDAYARGIS